MSTVTDYLYLTILKFLNVTKKHKIKLAGYTIYFGNIKYLKLLYKEIFISKNYECDLSDTPYIIDAGANIGLAILYLKKHYPKATIKAFEPDAESFEFLKQNMEANNIQGVELYNSALGDYEGTLSFYKSTGMLKADVRGSASIEQARTHVQSKGDIVEVNVPCQKLSPFVDKDVDLLKMDIEGSEGKVLQEINSRFKKVRNLIMEYHYQSENSDNKLSDILTIIEENNHEYHLQAIDKTAEVRSTSCYMVKTRLKNAGE